MMKPWVRQLYYGLGVYLMTTALQERFPHVLPGWAVIPSLIIGTFFILFALILWLKEKYGLRPDVIWFSIKPWGISWHFRDCLAAGVGGSENDLRVTMFRAHFRNNMNRWIHKISGYVENEATEERYPIRLNFDGEFYLVEETRGIPPTYRLYIDVPFTQENVKVMDQNKYETVAKFLENWHGLRFFCEIEGRQIEKRFSQKFLHREINKAINAIRDRRLNSPPKIRRN